MTDEGLGTTTCGIGACQRSVNNCVAGVTQSCTPGTATAESCNGMDDDCDGAIDDGVTQACSTACESGVRACSGGALGACNARVPSTGRSGRRSGQRLQWVDGRKSWDDHLRCRSCQRTVTDCVAVFSLGTATTETCNNIDDN